MSKHNSGRKCTFQSSWTDVTLEPVFSKFIARVPNDKYSACCRLCKVNISLLTMGRRAITSHMESTRHKTAVAAATTTPQLRAFLPVGGDEAGTSTAPTGAMKQPQLDVAMAKATSKAEMGLMFNCIAKNQSFNSVDDSKELFGAIFPDSSIAAQMSVSRSKMSRDLYFGVAPYIQELLLKSIGNQAVVLCFDESMNDITQTEQLDFNVRYFDAASNHVTNRYLNSAFLGRTRAKDLLEAIKVSVTTGSPISVVTISSTTLGLYSVFEYISARILE